MCENVKEPRLWTGAVLLRSQAAVRVLRAAPKVRLKIVVQFADRVNMDHAVFNIRKVFLNGQVNVLGNPVGFQQGQAVRGAYFHIHEDAGTEHAGLEPVDMGYPRFFFNQGPHLV